MPSPISFVHFDSNYLTTFPGMVKVSCLVSKFGGNYWNVHLIQLKLQVLTFVGFLIVQLSSFWNGYSEFFKAITIIEFIFTGILFISYMFCIPYVYNGIPWLKVEFFWSVAATIFLALASLLLAINGSGALFVAAVSVTI